VLIPVQFLSVFLRLPAARAIPVLYHRGVARVLRLRIDIDGELAFPAPVLFVANHSSWLDIVVLSSISPVSFVAKSEISRWPGISILAKLQRSVFVERRRGRTVENRHSLSARLKMGDNVVLFAEGTAADGNHVLPFKSALFAAAAAAAPGRPEPLVQPVSIAYTHLDGFPLGRRYRHRLAWYGRMALGAHLWNLLGHGESRAQVKLHAAVRFSTFSSRKLLAAHCHARVSASHAAALAGRPLRARSRRRFNPAH
jgi:1-acyl-sn-glycerol-3-phosphate acyltransferase